jgi:hypothetical protein
MGYTPRDFFLNAFSFFGVVVPGALLTYAVLKFNPGTPLEPHIKLVQGGTEGWLVFAGASLILGWAIQPPSSIVVDWVYDNTYRKWKRRQGDANYEFAKRKAREEIPESYSIYKWAENDVRAREPETALELNMAQGISKLFRALTLFCLVACGLAFYRAAWGWGVALLVGGVVCFLVFAERRWSATLLVYQRFRAIHTQGN